MDSLMNTHPAYSVTRPARPTDVSTLYETYVIPRVPEVCSVTVRQSNLEFGECRVPAQVDKPSPTNEFANVLHMGTKTWCLCHWVQEDKIWEKRIGHVQRALVECYRTAVHLVGNSTAAAELRAGRNLGVGENEVSTAAVQ
ncbi:hypothetical protein PMIN07_002690 [Paraphaeosphaeria minitans]